MHYDNAMFIFSYCMLQSSFLGIQIKSINNRVQEDMVKQEWKISYFDDSWIILTNKFDNQSNNVILQRI